jgi:hypothetical protein
MNSRQVRGLYIRPSVGIVKAEVYPLPQFSLASVNRCVAYLTTLSAAGHFSDELYR